MGQILAIAIEKQRKLLAKAKSAPAKRSNLHNSSNSAFQKSADVWPIAGGPEVKLVVVGSGGVGKSSLTLQFVHNCFPEDYDPTIEDNFRKQAVVDEGCQMLDILDTAGQEEFNCMKDQWIRGGEGFLVVYSVDDRKSFEDVSEHREFIMKVKDSVKGPIVLVGNKCDLSEHERRVSYFEGKQLAESLGIHCFFEASAKNKINVEECFHELVREVRRYANGQR